MEDASSQKRVYFSFLLISIQKASFPQKLHHPPYKDKRAKKLNTGHAPAKRRTSDYSRHETPQLPDSVNFSKSSVSRLPYGISLYHCKVSPFY